MSQCSNTVCWYKAFVVTKIFIVYEILDSEVLSHLEPFLILNDLGVQLSDGIHQN